jgi:hypothetical protein
LVREAYRATARQLLERLAKPGIRHSEWAPSLRSSLEAGLAE